MKQLMIYATALLITITAATEVNAQKRGKGRPEKERKEYAKYHKKQQKAGYKYAKGVDKSYREYYKERDKAYKQYVKRQGKRYRDHDAWYYGERYHRRSEYVYFPAYRTYYDPYRRGYVYRHRNAWIFAPTMPSFMMGLNLGAVNVQFMANLPI